MGSGVYANVFLRLLKKLETKGSPHMRLAKNKPQQQLRAQTEYSLLIMENC